MSVSTYFKCEISFASEDKLLALIAFWHLGLLPVGVNKSHLTNNNHILLNDIYIYVYIERERKRENRVLENGTNDFAKNWCTYRVS